MKYRLMPPVITALGNSTRVLDTFTKRAGHSLPSSFFALGEPGEQHLRRLHVASNALHGSLSGSIDAGRLVEDPPHPHREG